MTCVDVYYLQDSGEFKRKHRIVVLEWKPSGEIQKNMTVYNFDTVDVDGKPEVQFMCLKRLVGERGFEPPTPWSRTRFQRLLNSIEFCRS
jgi:hypothetical protein